MRIRTCNVWKRMKVTLLAGLTAGVVLTFRFMMVIGGGVKKGLDIQIDMVAKTLGVEVRRAS